MSLHLTHVSVVFIICYVFLRGFRELNHIPVPVAEAHIVAFVLALPPATASLLHFRFPRTALFLTDDRRFLPVLGFELIRFGWLSFGYGDIKAMNGANFEVELSKDNRQLIEGEALKEDCKKGKRKRRHKGKEEVSTSGSHFVDCERFYSECKGINEVTEEFSNYDKKKKKNMKKGKQKKTPSPISLIGDGAYVEDEDRKKKRQKKEVNNESNNSTQCAVNYSWENDKEQDNNKKRKDFCLEVEQSEDSSKQKAKKVSFSSEVEELLPDRSSYKGTVPDTSRWGKRYSPEEDDLIRNAVTNYIEDHQLGDQGLHMVLNFMSYRKQIRDCWDVIAASLPGRSKVSVCGRARTLFLRSEERKWLPEELRFVKRFYTKYGRKWKECAAILGRHPGHVRDAWRRVNNPHQKLGQWSQDEYQRLFDLVNMDLRMKVFEEKKRLHPLIRDNISWEAISSKFVTRRSNFCCKKWYNDLASSMINEGLWSNLDDHKLITKLQEADPYCIEDVDWDNLLENRSGQLCRKRWYQMIRHIVGFWRMSFAEQLEILSQRYYPEMIEYLQNKKTNKPDL
ncbi:hypothetical protein HPP92_007266 [Vanilla planifolia]|uniref:Cyclin-D-binding Myb-like transcription factor 1 n=1 Tax=Vanilla planifolia TaxID=51239 RepID=A0A835VAH7_VANPL|nr:hypothetical protein HPP92_007266 [Vanilla planifolia]